MGDVKVERTSIVNYSEEFCDREIGLRVRRGKWVNGSLVLKRGFT